MTARVALPFALIALGLVACAKQSTPTAAAPPAPVDSQGNPEVRTASADDADADAREDGFASAAEQARARAYGGDETEAPVEEPPGEARR